MTKTINLSSKIEKHLPAGLVTFIQRAGEIAASEGQGIYLVGGVVRDLLLGQANLDLDLVVEGDAVELAQHLAEINQAKITIHRRFGTAKLKWKEVSIDVATARAETYTKPGALPEVKPSSIDNDLFRRDFTINAMAIHLNPARYGELLDHHGSRDDLKHKLIRVLHEKSFTDDATRIWRGLRYEQRLDSHLESTTLQLLKRDIPMLDTVSGDRIRYELECILKEEFPEKIIRRADGLKVLPKLHPALKGNGWLTESFEQARQLNSPNSPSVGLYLAILAYPFTKEETENLISRLRLPKSTAQILQDASALKTKLQSLADSELAPSRIYRLLHGYSSTALIANSLADGLPTASQNIRLYLNKLRYVKTSLTGEDLKMMGIPPGPDIGAILYQMHEARLDGEITTRQDEQSLVDTWVAHKRRGK